MRLVKHSNPDAMPSMWPPDDGTAWREDGTKEGDAAGGLFICLAVMFAVAVALIAWGSR